MSTDARARTEGEASLDCDSDFGGIVRISADPTPVSLSLIYSVRRPDRETRRLTRKIKKMATDVEESDTDDHERPAPPKRTRLLKVNETCWETEKRWTESEELMQETEDTEYDDVEIHAREKLKRWQACQVAKGFVDNTVNRVLENYIKGAHPAYPVEVSRFHLFRGNDMEDTAVMMAIRNHGLVQSAGLGSESRAFYGDKAQGYWTNSDYGNVHCSCPPSGAPSIASFPGTLATTSRDSLRLDASEGRQYDGSASNVDKVDDSDQQEDFLERAVAEAIKKKGLSALSVDYG